MSAYEEAEAHVHAERFTLLLAEALHRYGTPAHRLERELQRVSASLGLTAEFLSTPTAIQVAFGPRDAQRVSMLRVEPGDADLGKLGELQEVIEDVLSKRVTLEVAHESLRTIVAASPRHGFLVTVFGFALTSACAARFFGGAEIEWGLTFVLALLVGALGSWLPRRPHAMGLFEPLAAFLVTSASYVSAHVWTCSAEIITLASLIVLLPGLTLTVALTELTTRHLVSGTARLTGALTIFMTMGFGVAFARALVLRFLPASDVFVPATPSFLTEIVALLLAPLGFAVLFQAGLRQVPIIALAGIASFIGARLGANALGPELGVFVGALTVGLVSQAYARLTGKPASVPLLPGILLLVPGSLGFRSLSFFLLADVTSGMETGFRMILVGMSLVGGLLTANALLPPRREL